MRKLLLAAIGALMSIPATAADMAVKIPQVTAAAPCTQTNCSGPYGGLSLYGEGGNGTLNIPIGGSIFAGGGAIGANAGWQFWNGSWFAAAQFDLLYEAPPSAGLTNLPSGGALAMVHTKLGGNLGTLLGTSVPSPSQGPISIPQQLLANVTSAYIDPGCMAIRKGSVQYCGGAGVQLNMGGRWTADVLYDYGAPTSKLNALQIVGLNLDYHF